MGARGSISARQDLRPVNGRRLINGTSYSRSTAAPGRSRRVRRYCARGFLGTVGREWSAIKNVARTTATTLWQRGHCGSIVLPATPSRYDSGALQWGQGLNRACIMALDDSRILGPSRPQLGAWLVELARPQGSVACAPSDRPRVATVPCGFSPAMAARKLGRLRVHLLACCPGHLMDLVGPSLGVEATLRHFHVEPEPEPPEAA